MFHLKVYSILRLIKIYLFNGYPLYMKNITGTRGAGSITAAQFLKRFVGNVSWAHLDIAGVTWSKKGTNFSRAGGTGFGVRLLDEFVKKYYEDRS